MRLHDFHEITKLLDHLHTNYMALKEIKQSSEVWIRAGNCAGYVFKPVIEDKRETIIQIIEADLEAGIAILEGMGVKIAPHDLRDVRPYDRSCCTPPHESTDDKPA